MRTSGSFLPHEFTELVRRAPRKASTELGKQYTVHKTAVGVAAALGTSTRTLKRWLVLLSEAGHPIRDAVRARRGWPLGRPRGPGIAANLRGRKKKLPKR